MGYVLSVLVCGLGYFAFILSVDPQLMPPGIKAGMAITFLCLAAMMCLGWYIVKQLEELMKNETDGRDEIDL